MGITRKLLGFQTRRVTLLLIIFTVSMLQGK
jgi:hypothetical protein